MATVKRIDNTLRCAVAVLAGDGDHVEAEGDDDEGEAGLFGLGQAEVAGRHYFEAVGAEEIGELDDLAGVVGRQHQPAGGEPAAQISAQRPSAARRRSWRLLLD